ncbi:SH3-domain-containing protein [Marasmius fiardii PR-910]|nr:SH3-domain-containing protein [Marasmius fiardii PR-910]
MSTDTQKDALLSHVVSQIEQNVQFLISQNYISQADASSFLTKLSNVDQTTVARSTTTAMPTPTPFARRANGASAAPSPPAHAPASQLPTCKALWPYNENGAESEDLSFSAGDIIEIVEETNPDWWMGRVHGKQALFPSSYVEKVQAPVPPITPARAIPPPISHQNSSEKPVYRPFGAAHSGVNQPPPPGAGTNSVGLQQDEGQEKKKSKFGKYGNTMAHSAAGGVGFGAGAAIGGGLVRAIF